MKTFRFEIANGDSFVFQLIDDSHPPKRCPGIVIVAVQEKDGYLKPLCIRECEDISKPLSRHAQHALSSVGEAIVLTKEVGDASYRKTIHRQMYMTYLPPLGEL